MKNELKELHTSFPISSGRAADTCMRFCIKKQSSCRVASRKCWMLCSIPVRKAFVKVYQAGIFISTGYNRDSKNFHHVDNFYPHTSLVYRVTVFVRHHTSVFYQNGRLNAVPHKPHHTILPRTSSCLLTKNWVKFWWKHPNKGGKCRWGRQNCMLVLQ